MTRSILETVPDPLRPVGAALLDRAHADAERVLADVDAETAGVLTRAGLDADAILAEARAQGEADAAGVLATERARARRQARAVVLAARRETYEELRAQVLRELRTLRTDPGYDSWRDALRDRVHADLGADAVVSEHPDGGVTGRVAGRRVEYTLVGLADRALDALGSDVEGLWSG